MGYGQADVYYQPGEFDLRPVGEIDYSSGSYEFDIRMVWQHVPTGTLYTMRDSGCSCPSPFEDYVSLESLDVLDISAVESEARDQLRQAHGYVSASDVANFLRAIRAATR